MIILAKSRIVAANETKVKVRTRLDQDEIRLYNFDVISESEIQTEVHFFGLMRIRTRLIQITFVPFRFK